MKPESPLHDLTNIHFLNFEITKNEYTCLEGQYEGFRVVGGM